VQGLAASVPYDRDDRFAAVNRRISIIVMNRDAEDRFLGKRDADDALPTTDSPTPPQDR
jgi:chemotaxis protein MotB